MSLVDLLGPKLLSKAGDVDTATALEGKTVGIYFSAHWCPPCRGFTPKLAEGYTAHLKAKNMEIVFVSSDRDDASFTEYFGEMPWLALPFDDRDRKAALSKKYKVQGIPSFVILDSAGQLITKDGRKKFEADPEGTSLPWAPKPLDEILGQDFLGKDGPVTRDAFKGKVLGIYFSAHWCPPCRGFTPELVKTYKTLQESGKNFEILFASSDRDTESFQDYYKDMPWLALPYDDRKRKEELSDHFGVQGIPSLVILDEDLKVISRDGRESVGADPSGAEFPWHPKPINDLASPNGINESPCVCVFLDSATKEDQDALVTDLTPLAEKYVKEEKYLFFVARNGEGFVPRLRTLTGLPEDGKPVAVLLDVPDKLSYYVLEGEVTRSSIEKFISDYEAKTLEKKTIKND